MNTLTADLGGTRIKLALVADGAVRAQRTVSSLSGRPLAERLPTVAESFEDMCSEAGVPLHACKGVAFGFPSLVDVRAKRVTCHFGKFADAVDLDLQRWSHERLGLPFLIENDARAALIGEWRHGAGRGCTDLVMITLGTGIGTAVISNGAPLHGRHGQAGNLCGHLPYITESVLSATNHAPCSCGNLSCYESVSGSWSLPTRARCIETFHESKLRFLEAIDYEAVFCLAAEGDQTAVTLRDRALRAWGDLCVSMIHAFDPQCIVVGGGVMRAAEVILPALESYVEAHAVAPRHKISIAQAILGDQAAAYGLAWMIEDMLQASE